MFSRNQVARLPQVACALFSSARSSAFIVIPATLIAVTSIGCGKQETASTGSAPPANLTMPVDSAADAEAVVSSFLDRIRRGGENHDAMSLLTARAQSELKRVGQVVQPIGSPDARFRVTRSTPMPVQAGAEPINGRLVHCVWSEPAGQPSGQQGGPQDPTLGRQEYQVVWSVVMQENEYKISGLILEMDPNQPPMVLDFENGDLMASILGGEPEAQTANNPAAAEATSIR